MVEASTESSTPPRADIKTELKQALEDAAQAMTKRDKATEDMFQLYANLLSVNARYPWNKIVQEQTNADPYTDLQGLTRKGPRGMSRQSFEDYASSTFSSCSPIAWLSRRSTTSRMC
jgi:hypothetical protein